MIDTARIREQVITRATAGLRNATEYALERAQHHAPVRAIFDRRISPRGPAISNPMRPIRSRERIAEFRRSQSRRARVDVAEAPQPRPPIGVSQNLSEATNDNPTGAFAVGGGPTQLEGLRDDVVEGRLQTSGRRTQGKRLGGRTSFTGNANSLIPVFRKGKFKATGDFRRFSPTGGLTPVPGYTQHTSPESLPKPFSRQKGASIANRSLTSRGRFEVKMAQARGLFNGRVGGRLRGELRITGPENHAGGVWMYVESPTPYAPFQEFGTSRHRAQPFLRPALYESRNVLRFEVRKAIDRSFSSPIAEE